MITSSQIKSLAESLGFDACGIACIDDVGATLRGRPQEGSHIGLPLQEGLEHLREWVAQGCHGTMKYLEDFEERSRRFWENFPEAKSIIVVGVNYYSRPPSAHHPQVVGSLRASRSEAKQSPSSEIAPPPHCGSGVASASLESPPRNDVRALSRVARYAWGQDYHQVIRKRLEQFCDQLSEIAGRKIRAEICVDTKPLLERSLAQKAGLGFIGKQSQLLSPQFGPWLFLAELVTDLELEPDTPFTGSCGTCRICIDQCPTQAIRPEGGIDARRCIAYLTIEHKGEMAESLRPLVGDWVFGCDICLEVCPYTSKAKETRWTELKAESGKGPFLDLLKLLEIPSNGAYRKEFEGTAIMRASRNQLFRNAKVVLENLASTQLVFQHRVTE